MTDVYITFFNVLIQNCNTHTLCLGKCDTVFAVLKCTVQTVSVYICSIEISQFFSLNFTNLCPCSV
jgi:hypothetical protein